MLFTLAWRNLWRNKLRSFVVVLTFSFGLIGVNSVISFINGMFDSMVQSSIDWQSAHLLIQSESYKENPDINSEIPAVNTLETQLGLIDEPIIWSSRFKVDGVIASSRYNQNIKLYGVDPKDENAIRPFKANLVEGAWLSPEQTLPVMISTTLSERLSAPLHSKIVISFADQQGEVVGSAFRVTGLFKTPVSQIDKTQVLVSKKDLTRIVPNVPIHEIAVYQTSNKILDSDLPSLALKEKILASFHQPIKIETWLESNPTIETVISTAGIMQKIIMMIFASAMIFGIINVMFMSIFERTREFGVLMAIGMTKNNIRQLILIETLVITLSSALLGTLFSLLIIALTIKHGVNLENFAQGLEALGINAIIYPQIAYQNYLLIFSALCVGSLFSSIYISSKITKKSALEAMSETH